MIRRLLRTIALLTAVATATMPGVLAVAEGVLQAAATGSAAAHVEAAGGSESCPVAHDAHCATCSMLRHGHTGPACAPAAPVFARLAIPALHQHGLVAQNGPHAPGNPRAPPAA